MKYLLDTNACIHSLRTKGNALVKQRVGQHPPSDLALCSIVTAELRHGAAVSAKPAAGHAQVNAFVTRFIILPFDDAAASRYAEIRADLEARGIVIGDFDMMIAAIALIHGLIVVTHNTRDFSRITGLVLEDWEIP
jgi:tRNA(fMet)-specific endonuclease VapC